MLYSYPHKNLWLKGSNVSIDSVMSQTFDVKTEFERETIEFIRSWLSGQQVYKLQTSGSTGTPKTISLRADQMKQSAMMTREALSLNSDMTALICLDTKYIAGKMMLVRSLEIGMKMVVVEPSSDPLSEIADDVKFDFAAMVPLQVKTLLESKHPHSLNRISKLIIGGAPVSEELENTLKNFEVNCYQTYGMTETISHVALRRMTVDPFNCYSSLKNISIDTDTRSCLTIKAPFLDEEIVTNDVVEIINTGVFRWIGRADNIINSGGVKISPEIVETEIGKIFTRSHYQQPFFLYAVPDKALGDKMVLVTGSPAPAIELIRELKASLTQTFSPFHVPRQIFEASQFIFTPTQKVDRRRTFLLSSSLDHYSL